MSVTKSLLFLVCLVFTISLQGQELFKENIMTKWEGQHRFLLECIDLIEEKDLTFKPMADAMDLRSLILHMGANMHWITTDYLQGSGYMPRYQHKDLNKAELRQHMDDLFTFAKETLQSYPIHQLKTRVDFFAGEKNMMQLVELLDDHVTHHKGQLTVYMRLVGKKAPRFIGW